jgi:GTPase Era involved in 16S rRNA processing
VLLEEVGTDARPEAVDEPAVGVLGKKVFLELEVEVDSHWVDRME